MFFRDCFLDHAMGKHLQRYSHVPGNPTQVLAFTAVDPPCGCSLRCSDRELADAAVWQLTHLNPVTHDECASDNDDEKNYLYKNKTKY